MNKYQKSSYFVVFCTNLINFYYFFLLMLISSVNLQKPISLKSNIEAFLETLILFYPILFFNSFKYVPI